MLFDRDFVNVSLLQAQSHVLSAKLESKSQEPYKFARKELIASFPGVLAILGDVWFFASLGVQPRTPVGNPHTICGLILGILGPLAKAQPQVLLHSTAAVWQSRGALQLNSKKNGQAEVSIF